MNRHVRCVPTFVALLGVIASTVACTSGPAADGEQAATVSTVADSILDPLGVADLPAVASGDLAQITVMLDTASRAASDELLQRTGIVALLPNAGDALDRIEAAQGAAGTLEGAGLVDGPSGFRRSLPVAGARRAAVTPLSSRGAALGMSTLGAAINGSLRHGADGAPLNGDQVVDYGPVTADTPSAQARTVDGSTELRVVKRGSEAVDGGQIAVDMDLRGTLDACPTADGAVTGEMSVDVRIDATSGPSSAGGRYTLHVVLTASVDDTARLTGFVVEAAGSASDTVSTTGASGPAVDGWFVEGGSRATIAGHPAEDLTVTGLDDASVTRASTSADAASAETFLVHQSTIAVHLGAMVLLGAEDFWRSGECVDVQLVPAGDPSAVQPGDELTVGIEATAAGDGQPIGAPATAVATATGGTLAPSGVAQQVPASVRYAVPADGSDGEITAEVTSRRGIGTGTLPVTAAQTIVVDAQLDVFRATGAKCGGVAGEWELALTASFDGYPFSGALTFELAPDTWTGTYTLTGSTSGGGITVQQHGSGTVATRPAPHGPTLVFTGTAWTGGPTQVISIDTSRVAGTAC